MIGAHPDDEDTALLSYLARGEGARTAYLSLTRGDGGQNIIGTELGESLGLIRTEELLQARRLDGAEQYFTRAYDYGFSKTLAEAKQKWDEKIVLCDAVRVIRQFQPLVVVSQFSGTPADGHGQHQYSGYISPLAIEAAADRSLCLSSGDPWRVRKFYVRHRGNGEPRLRINTGTYDFLLGRSYFEIAMEARSQHRSQEQGVLELRGEQYSNLNLVGSEAKENSIFDGIDTSIEGDASISAGSDAIVSKTLKELGGAAASASRGFDARNPEKILKQLVDGYVLSVSGVASTSATRAFFTTKTKQIAEAIRLAAGIKIDALADRETVVPGESLSTAVKVFVGAKSAVKIKSARIITPKRWTVTSAEAPREATQGFFRRETGDFAAYYSVGVPSDAQPTQPYWLSDPRDGDLFRWRNDDNEAGQPFHRPMPMAEVTAEILGTQIVFQQPMEYRYADDTAGEIRRNLDVVPAVSVELDKPLAIVPFSAKGRSIQVAMTITNNLPRPVSGKASLNLTGSGLSEYKGAGQTFNIQRPGEKVTVLFEVVIPSRQPPGGTHFVVGYVEIPEGRFRFTSRPITHPHIQTHRIYEPAMTQVAILDLKTAPVKVGYVPGSGDRVADALRQMGFSVEIVTAEELANGDLSKYDTLVVGVRAYQVRPDLVANNKRLLDYANAGGTLIVQYQLPGYAQQNLAPFPHRMGPRVADENAPVKILQPEHPLFNFPNKITDADFEGWVQERNLYNFSTMDAKYTGLLESHDTGEPENKGGLVIADVGKGKFIYCSYSFFRQLPAGVDGAYRLFANMLSLPKSKRPTK